MKLPVICPEGECCCGNKGCAPGKGLPKVVLIGNPNVGKSSLFNALSGSYTLVSNYPGTSVEISRGKTRIREREYEVIDTPGMYSLLPVSEEERVSQLLVFEEEPLVYLHVLDARNLRRMLSFTLQLLEAGLPLILVLNMMDEAEERGIEIDIPELSRILGIPVIGTVSSEGKGVEDLKTAISEYNSEYYALSIKKFQKLDYGIETEPYIEAVESLLGHAKETGISKRAISLLLLQEDRTALEYLPGAEKSPEYGRAGNGKNYEEILKLIEEASKLSAVPLSYFFTLKRQESVNGIVEQVMEIPERMERENRVRAAVTLTGKGSWKKGHSACTGQEKVKPEKETKHAGPGKKKRTQQRNIDFSEKIDNILIHPVLGIPVLFLVLYFGLYQFVGVFAAGTVVDLLENTVFGEYINPLVTSLFESFVPYPALQDLFVGEYGIFTQAVTYAIALILPIVGAFFLVFSIIEDTGYLPRLSLLLDSMFKKIGLSGRAVIPMVLGFGCSTMATMVTRTLETKRERLIANVLLALAIPCSAQLGIILSILSGNPKALPIWAGVIVLEFILIGYLASRILPGEAPTFILEMPPLRRPKLSNILVKTYSRMHWYFLEVLPLFVVASILIWIGRLTGIFDLALKVMEYPTVWIGLPPNAADVFLFGFFRRDFGAAGLYGMYDSGLLTGLQLVVAAVTLTLFMPCIAQFMMTVKERGLKTALVISGFIFPFAFLTGFIVNTLLTALGVSL
ncbi:ferrous iron transport protein B [Methanosarcina sp. MSH10X1]|uniref:ferrous iron transport protein B n=1 Tax=Methanosarcina sp. MSH10X1 TaxID=2507075 RepID=UPI000FFC385B|nr:ferrous iron transport protein B [Methanosarcina sp. MSH10X1]RXA21270.1 ferrous iron transport protein B [Methanosarcina sp. MSH10X1]